ncbi:MaoC family dehydratase [Thalassospira marina]|uniref:MaoC family dehydratase n=1 Tax=Thalassospira marina TaxID=2048283 RepID=UPI001FEAFFC4|nr:MaoC family dehydratase [Thalassospira marina]
MPDSTQDIAPLYMDDLFVGQRFKSGTHSLDAAQIMVFARQFDPQYFHLDDVQAKTSLFGGLAASGWHTAALTMRMIVDSTPFPAGVIGTNANVKWPMPTRPGDVLHVESEIMSITPSQSRPDRGRLVMKSLTLNDRGDVVQELEATILVSRKPQGEVA